MSLHALVSNKPVRPFISHFSSSKIMGGCTFKTHRVYSNLSLKNCEEIHKLSSQLEKEGSSFSNLTLPRTGLDKYSIRQLLTSIGKRSTHLPACGSTNPAAAFTMAKVFLKPDFVGLKSLERDLKAGKNMWGYQMQNIPLNEANIEQLADHILEIYQNNDVVLTINEKASVLFQPGIDPKTSKPDLSNRTFVFYNEANQFKEDL